MKAYLIPLYFTLKRFFVVHGLDYWHAVCQLSTHQSCAAVARAATYETQAGGVRVPEAMPMNPFAPTTSQDSTEYLGAVKHNPSGHMKH